MTRRVSGYITGSIGHALYCPHGHRIQASWMVVGEQFVHCSHRSHRSAEKCEAMLWVVVLRHGLAFAAQVTVEDVRAIKGHTSIAQTFAYLGTPLPLYPIRQPTGGAAA